MKNVFNTVFENMLRLLLLMKVLNSATNVDRLAALDFMCIYGRKCKVLDRNLHGDNEFGFAEFTNKREKITDAIKLAVRNDYVTVEKTCDGLLYSLNVRGEQIVDSIRAAYSKDYMRGAKMVSRKFANSSDEEILRYINKMATK